MQRLVELVQRRATRAGASASSAGRWRCWSRAPAAPTRARLRGRTRHNKAVNFEGTARAGELVEVEIAGATSTDADRQRAAAQPRPPDQRRLAIFGPTAVGKTGVAIAVAELLRERGEDPVAVNCDSIQVYRGLEVLSGAASAEQRSGSSTGCSAFVAVDEEFSAGRFAELAHAEIDSLLAAGRRPIVVGGTGLYLRAALSELELRPPVPAEVRAEVEDEIAAAGPGGAARRASARARRDCRPGRSQAGRPLDRAARGSGIEPPASERDDLDAKPRHPTLLVGLTLDRDELDRRIDARVEAMAAAGAGEEVRAAVEAGASRTARAAIGFEELL